jgi:hypothetical protein
MKSTSRLTKLQVRGYGRSFGTCRVRAYPEVGGHPPGWSCAGITAPACAQERVPSPAVTRGNHPPGPHFTDTAASERYAKTSCHAAERVWHRARALQSGQHHRSDEQSASADSRDHSRLPVTRCQICYRTVAYRPGNLSEVLTGHYRRAHPEPPGFSST